LIRVKRGTENIAKVRIGNKTFAASRTCGDLDACVSLAGKVAAALRADSAVVERYKVVSLHAGRAALRLTFDVRASNLIASAAQRENGGEVRRQLDDVRNDMLVNANGGAA
jgi:hypothetical protein